MAFLPPLRLPLLSYSPPHLSLSSFSPPTSCAKSPAPRLPRHRQATLFSNGDKLTLVPLKKNPSRESSTPVYILCPACNSAYLGNALTSSQTVQCAKCKNLFQTSPSALYVDESASSSLLPNVVDGKEGNGKVKILEQPKDGKVLCRHFDECSGCTVSGKAAEPPVLSNARTFLKRQFGKQFVTVEIGDVHGWRSNAKLAVRSAGDGSAVCGLFKRGTHELVRIGGCAVHNGLINQAVLAVEDAMRRAGVRPYDEGSGEGDVKYVIFSVGRDVGKVQVTLVWNASGWKDAQPGSSKVGVLMWKGKWKGILHSIWCNWNTGGGNLILAMEQKRFYHMYGPIEMRERVMGVGIYFGPYVFRQANLEAFEKLVLPQLLRYVPVGSRVAEFCAGVGVIGLVALRKKRLKYLVASEINEMAQNAFWRAYQDMREEGGLEGVAEYIVGSDVDTMYMINDEIEVVIVDPPRAGLTEEFVKILSQPKAKALQRIIYLSCGFQAFQNDARVLCTGNGEWELRDAHAFVLFPGGDHIETLAIFDRVDGERKQPPPSQKKLAWKSSKTSRPPRRKS